MENAEEDRIKITVGDEKAQQSFADKHRGFLISLDSLKIAFESFSSHLAGKEDDLIGRSLFYLAYLAWEDFNEILVLSANGLTTGAQKILRGMFERTVTTNYLQKHPNEIELFWNYYWIDQNKLAADLEREFPDVFPKENLDEIKAKYDEVKELYQVPVCKVCKLPDCEECKKTRVNHTWSKKDIISMAKEVGVPTHIIKGAYYLPLNEAHPKVGAIIVRIDQLSGSSKTQNGIEIPFIVAYGLLLAILERVLKALGRNW